MKKVHEYCFADQKWLSDSQWSFLLKEVNDMSPVVTNSAVHLIGGLQYVREYRLTTTFF